MTNKTRLLYISRPFIDSNSGTGEQATAREVVTRLLNRGGSFQTKFIKKIIFKPYHGFISLLFYDWFLAFSLSLSNLVRPSKIVIFNSPYQAIFCKIFNLRSRTICIVNDLFFMDYANKNLFDRYSYCIFKYFIKHCGTIIVTSTETAAQLYEIFNYPSIVVPLGHTIREEFKNLKMMPTSKVGYIGSYVPRKRPQYLHKLANLGAKGYISLNLAGRIPQGFIDSFSPGSVSIIGEVPESKKINFFRSISFLYFPTELEGFGLPLVEAMSCGVIPIVHLDSKIPSVIKNNCIQVTDTEEAYNIIILLMKNTSQFDKLIIENYEYSSKFSWDKFTDALITNHE